MCTNHYTTVLSPPRNEVSTGWMDTAHVCKLVKERQREREREREREKRFSHEQRGLGGARPSVHRVGRCQRFLLVSSVLQKRQGAPWDERTDAARVFCRFFQHRGFTKHTYFSFDTRALKKDKQEACTAPTHPRSSKPTSNNNLSPLQTQSNPTQPSTTETHEKVSSTCVHTALNRSRISPAKNSPPVAVDEHLTPVRALHRLPDQEEKFAQVFREFPPEPLRSRQLSLLPR